MADVDEPEPRSNQVTRDTGRDPRVENLARHGAPIPPQSPCQMPASPLRRRAPRLLAAGAALAVIAGATGAGFALGRLDHNSVSSAGAPPEGTGGGTPDGQPNDVSPYGGTSPFGGTPFTGPGDPGGTPFDSSSSGTPASATQLTGLVRIVSTLKYQGGRAAGTGMVLTDNGEVVTNHHVVEGATKVRVTVMSTGATYHATVVGTDAQDDVAVLQLQGASGLQTVTPDTHGVSVGDAVTAVGDAGGDTSSFTAAPGKVLAEHQRITTSSEPGHPGEKLRGLIKISSDVISGDSGGATYDAAGDVIGMTTAASSGTRDVVGFAIPIDKVRGIAEDLENGARNTRYEYGSPAFLGIGLADRAGVRGDTRVGAVYPGTPADRGGITPGDTVTWVGSTRVRTATQLQDAVRALAPGDPVRIVWTDPGGASHVASVTLIAGPVA
jgi:S1-C subfamily serine protease